MHSPSVARNKFSESTIIRKLDTATPVIFALCIWSSLNPYFTWGFPRHLMVLAVITSVLFGIMFVAGHRPARKIELAGVIIISLFLVYITALPLADGTHIRWVLVLPTVWLFAIMDDRLRARTIKALSIVFAVTLLPGIVASLLLTIGVPLPLGRMPYYQPGMTAFYLTSPGALFVATDSLALPWGGVLYRMTGIYDEPGMVGTISALLLAADRFRLKFWQNLILFVAGILSFSLAFQVITLMGLVARVAAEMWGKRHSMALASALCGAIVATSASLTLGIVRFPAPPAPQQVDTTIAAAAPQQADTALARSAPHRADTTEPQQFDMVKGPAAPSTPQQDDPPVAIAAPQQVDSTEAPTDLRQTAFINNRSLPAMDQLLREWWNSDIKTLMLGISSDASALRSPTSQVFTRLFTDYGLVGFALLFLGFALTGISMCLRSPHQAWAALFLVCYLMSFYQRPTIWLPYAIAIFVGGTVYAGRSSGALSRRNTVETNWMDR